MYVKCLAQSLAHGKDSVNVAVISFAGISMLGSNGFNQSRKLLNLFERLNKKG